MLVPITSQAFIDSITAKNGFPPNAGQQLAITHGDGPIWIVAGPGTGKTEVLALRCLKLLCCDAIDPRSILVTTFTVAAGRNLSDRIAGGLEYLISRHPGLAGIDLSGLRIGNLHSLCNEILQSYRYEPYRDRRLLDGLDSEMFLRNRLAAWARDNAQDIHTGFNYLFKPSNFPPSLWEWTKAIKILLDHAVEDLLDASRLAVGLPHYAALARLAVEYDSQLDARGACDFARLQRYFLAFLGSPAGRLYLDGDPSIPNPPLTHILVDEYQDTNPIQEQIYFTLAGSAPHNLTVVGDDDQAMYRFRGGTVDCMVGFGERCQELWGIDPEVVQLSENYRSHRDIVTWCNSYIVSYPAMNAPGVRVDNKAPLVAQSGINGAYPAAGFIRRAKISDLATEFADTVLALRTNNIVEDYSQCVLLLGSAKESDQWAGPYADALRQRGIPVYNPRSKAYLEQPEVQELLGTIVAILDPDLAAMAQYQSPKVHALVRRWIAASRAAAGRVPELAEYIRLSQARIQTAPAGDTLSSAMPTVLYRILAHEPFVTYQTNPEQDLRLAKATRIIEAFCTEVGRRLQADNATAGVVNQYWLGRFYSVLCAYFAERGMDDDEDEEVTCPVGRFPIMTIHQSKGLEFDFVFVAGLGKSYSEGNAHQLEADLRAYRNRQPTTAILPAEAALHDAVRAHYVAYSRAKHSLALLATQGQLRKTSAQTASFGGNGGSGMTQALRVL